EVTNRPRGRDIILLSLFDGVGAAPYIIDRDFGRPRLAVSWEVDRACKALVQKALPWVEHRGDFTRDSPQDVADLVLDSDPHAEAMVVWCAAPPCQDFSRIAQGAGHQGDRGRLFEESVAFLDELRAALKSHRFAFLYENVEMGVEAAKVSSDALGVQPVFVCPSDFGWVSRPRLWWLSVDWTRLASDPADGSPLEWAKKGRWDRLRLAAGRKLMPCATTPAPTDDGRAKPRSTRGRTPRDADARWLEGGRQFAPWHYTVEAMLQDSKGVLHTPAAEVKEQLHHIPTGYTAKAGADAKTRHRMVGNGWHWGVASRLLGLLVMATWTKPVASGASPAPEPPEPQVLGEGLDEDRHWAAAARMKHSLVTWPTLEPALEAILEFRREWRHDLVRIRRDVLRELQEMVEDAAEDTDAWLATLPVHVRATYVTEDRPRPFQGLVFDRLLRGVGYPAADDLQQDVNAGFDMLGPVRPPQGGGPALMSATPAPRGWTG
ncbi:unnamed protein product, partial [Symbiodinium necroappetens]